MKRSHLFLIAAMAFALVGTIILLIAFGTAFDPLVSNYFSNGSALPVLSAVCLVLSIGLGIAGAVFAQKNPEELNAPALPSFATAPAAFGALGSAVWMLIAGKAWLGVLILLTSVFFTLEFCSIAKFYGKALLWLGFAAIAAPIAYNALCYFDMTVEMNAPVKVLLQMALLSAMLFITAECRLLSKRFDRVLIPILTTFCMTLCTAGGMVSLYLLLAKKETKILYLVAAPLLLGVGTTAIWRLLQMILPAKKIPDAIPEEPQTAESEETSKE